MVNLRILGFLSCVACNINWTGEPICDGTDPRAAFIDMKIPDSVMEEYNRTLSNTSAWVSLERCIAEEVFVIRISTSYGDELSLYFNRKGKSLGESEMYGDVSGWVTEPPITLTPDSCLLVPREQIDTFIEKALVQPQAGESIILNIENNELTLSLIDVSDGDPLGRYTLQNSFYLANTEVTQDVFTAIRGYSPCEFEDCGDAQGANFPAFYVSWHEWAAMSNELSVLEGLDTCYVCEGTGRDVQCTEQSTGQEIYSCPGYRLPTEAEWELAARSGTDKSFWTGEGCSLGGVVIEQLGCDANYVYDGANNPKLSAYEWFCDASTHPMEVGQLIPNGFGLYDMHGNLSEWTHDWYTSDWPSQNVDPIGLSGEAEYRSRRGGTWDYLPITMGTEYRTRGLMGDRAQDRGARIARTVY